MACREAKGTVWGEADSVDGLLMASQTGKEIHVRLSIDFTNLPNLDGDGWDLELQNKWSAHTLTHLSAPPVAKRPEG